MTAAGGREKRSDQGRVEAPSRASRLRYLAGCIFRPGGPQTNGGPIAERRCHFCKVAAISSPPNSTSRARQINVGEEIERWGDVGSAATAFPSGGIDGADGTRRTSAKRSRGVAAFCGVAMVIFQPESTAQDEQIRTGQKNLRQAQFWQCRLGYFLGGIERVGGEKTNDRQTLEPRAVWGVSPPLFVRRYFTPRPQCTTGVAKSLSHVAISAESPAFSPHRK